MPQRLRPRNASALALPLRLLSRLRSITERLSRWRLLAARFVHLLATASLDPPFLGGNIGIQTTFCQGSSVTGNSF